ncbi:MAG TPA: hypothetical protein VG275_09420 [Solirubrobacteraceae bacterium]|jgi:hypothetical protein|nr:hypothetical protein [Solirubrobacteraceae bacterium]
MGQDNTAVRTGQGRAARARYRYVIPMPRMPRFWVYTMYVIVIFSLAGMVIAITKLA